jgi:uncharacterized repeat protein (TIGR01451 family)
VTISPTFRHTVIALVLAVMASPVSRADDCDTNGCGIQSPLDCGWRIPNGDCALFADPVNQRLCSLGIRLDGDLSDAVANGAAVQLDQVPDEAVVSPGPTGYGEQPREVGDPNGFNIARAYLLFVPDEDPIDGVDTSFLYIGWDIADLDTDGTAPVPYDADDDGVACSVAAELDGAGTRDDESDEYLVQIQACSLLDNYQPSDANPNNVANDADLSAQTVIFPIAFPYLLIGALPSAAIDEIETFPTAQRFPTGDPIVNPTNGCIDREIRLCGSGNNVEMVIKRVESLAAFGDDPLSRRFALSELLARLGASSTGDRGDEELATVVLRTSLPDLNVTKQVRCVDSGNTDFDSNAVALPGSLVEFEIEIRNTGNEPLDVTVTDTMQSVGAQAGLVTCEPLCESLSATLTRNGVTTPITAANAAAFGLDVTFFIDLCATPDLGFLGSVRSGQPIRAGLLNGAAVERDAGTCGFTPGDVLTLRYRATPDVTDDMAFCQAADDPDCQNAVSVEGRLELAGPVVADDFADPSPNRMPDTDDELILGRDDNVATVDLLCREFDFLKDVGFPGQPGSFVSGATRLELPPVPLGGFIDVEFRYSGTNTGDVTETVTIRDPQLCADIATVGVTMIDCPLCPTGEITIPVAPGASYSSSCVLRFTSQAQLDAFLARDDGRSGCSADPESTCYRNCATATAESTNLGDVCDGVDVLEAESFATLCGGPCALRAITQVRCLDDCTPPADPEFGWVTDPADLDVIAGACVQYRIVTSNIGSNAICELRFRDEMLNSNAFASGPDNVTVSGDASCGNLPGEFNWDGVPFVCDLSDDLDPGERIVITFDAQVADPVSADLDPVNAVTVEGSSFCDTPPIFFECQDDSSVAVDLRDCGLNVKKQVTCDDPRSLNAVFADELTQAIPGATVGFRMQVCNDGQVTLPRVMLNDALSCSDWFVPDSVVADIAGTDVTACVCPGGVCATIDDLNGMQDLDACFTDGIPTNGCLTITFEVTVPADFDATGTPIDCTNTLTVGGFTETCSADRATACDQASDFANIDVRVPDLDCEKDVCADLGNDGSCDEPGDLPFTDDLRLPCDTAFPIRLFYRGRVSNTGETPLSGVQLCDSDLVAQAVAAGFAVGPCMLCDDPAPCDGVGDTCANVTMLDTNASATVLCEMVVPSRNAWLNFAGQDNDGDTECHVNTMTASAQAGGDGVCARGANGTVDTTCSARVCLDPPCAISVTKGVRCIDGCTTRSATGSTAFAAAQPGDFDGSGIMDLRDFARMTDCMSGPGHTPAPTLPDMTTADCLAVFDFDADGDVDIRDCGLFEASQGTPVDSLPAAPGATIEFEIKVTNDGPEDVCELSFSDTLTGDVTLCPNPLTRVQLLDGNTNPLCTLPADWVNTNGAPFAINLTQACGATMAPGDMLIVHLAGEVDADADGIIRNHVEVACAPDDGAGCSAGGTFCGDEVMDDALVPVRRCDFELTKEVTCDEPRLANGMVNTSAFYAPVVDSLPGATNGFAITVCNTGDAAISSIGLVDTLSCADWFVAGSVVADIDGALVTDCVCPSGFCASVNELSGLKRLADCRPGGLLAGECLRITFEVIVPDGYPALGLPVDCTNTVAVEGFTELCGPLGNPCPFRDADAEIDVERPAIECDKTACADVNTNGTCSDPEDFVATNGLELPCDIAFPFDLIYEVTVRNTGETPLVDARACDPELVADAVAAGLVVGPCDLCVGACDGVDDTCSAPANLAVGATLSALCTVSVPDADAWLAFSNLDGDVNSNCYANTAEASGAADTALYCSQDVDPHVSSSCAAEVCLEPRCDLMIECPDDRIVDCTEPTDPQFTGAPTVTHDCDPPPVVTHTDVTSNGRCPQEKVIYRTWRAEADCDALATCVQIIRVIDTNGPVITCPDDVAFECDAGSSGMATAIDDCDPDPMISFQDMSTNACPATIMRTWKATDACGNFNTCKQTITIDDTKPPVLTCPADITVPCDQPLPPCDTNGVSAVDSCGFVDVDCLGDFPDGAHCPGTILRKYRATDDCGNVTTCGQRITIVDDTPPMIECPPDITFECDAGSPGFPTVTDNCDPDPMVRPVDETSNGCPLVIKRTWIATDRCMNTNACMQRIVIDDTEPPEITCPDDLQVDCTEDVPPCDTNGIIAADSCGFVDVDCLGDDPDGEICPLTIVRRYRATDTCGNITDCAQIITVVDTNGPEVTCPPDLDLECTDSIDPSHTGFPTVADDCGSTGMAQFNDERDGKCPETIRRTWTALDSCGNPGFCVQTLRIDDNEPPELTCPPPLMLECDQPIPPCDTNGVHAADSCGFVDVDCAGDSSDGHICPETIVRKYRATDDCGNVTTCGQLIVIDDTTDPTIECPPDIDCSCPPVWRVLDFETDGAIPLPAGYRFDGYFPALGVTVQTDNAVPGHPDLAIIFDSANPTGNDGDLATPGYHPTNTTPYGKILIIAENDVDTSPPDTLVDDPDDEGGRPAGWIDLAFDDIYTAAELIICDVDQGEDGGSVEFFMDANPVGSRSIAVLGDNSIQTIAFAAADFNRIRVNLAGSSSIPEIRLKAPCVPDCDPGDPIVSDNCDTNALVTCVEVNTGGLGGSAYTWAWNPGEPHVWFSDAAGDWEAVSGTYDASNQRLDWEVVFSDQITDGITLVLSDGPEPANVGGVWTMFFFDATNPADPELLAYVYNGRNDRSSWYDGDPDTPGSQGGDLIESTLLDAGFINNLTVTDAGGKRTFRFSIDVSGINSHVPAFPNGDGLPYRGTGFDGGIGIWLGAFQQLETGYTNGRLVHWLPQHPNGYFDTGHLSTEFACEPSEILRRCTVVDDCGNTAECTQRIITEECVSCDCTSNGDVTPPEITCPADVLVACGDSTDPGDTGMATATDECDPFTTVFFTDSTPVTRDTTFTRTWTATDRCGNSITCDQHITIGGDNHVVIFHEDFEGYTHFPDQHPAGDPINAGLPRQAEGTHEVWYGGRFEGADNGDIDSDLAVQKFGGGTNNTKCGRVEDDAGLLFKVDTTIFSQATLSFDWRTFSVGSSDRLTVGYYVGEIDFASDTPDGTYDDFVRRFNQDGPPWEEWTQLLRDKNSDWQSESYALPTGEQCVWVAFWIDAGSSDFGKIDNVKVTVNCP